jgi:hypothetical protein
MSQICQDCGDSVGAGSAKFVNRVADARDLEARRDDGAPFPIGQFNCAECDNAKQRRTFGLTG